MENNTTITIRLPEELKQKIVFCAMDNDTTISCVIRGIVKDFFDWRKSEVEQ